MAYDGRNHFTQPALHVNAVDTMGAGDSFLAAFLNHWYSSESSADMPSAMRAAAEFASLVIQREGALGVGYDVTASRLMDTINIKMEGNT
jgi:fructoselysine 6-kinase